MAFTVVQAAPTVQASGSSATVTLAQATGTGNTLVAVITADQTTPPNPAVSGITLGGSADHWKAAATAPGADRFGVTVWYDPGCAAGQTSVVVSLTPTGQAGEELYAAVYEVGGALVFDQASSGNAASGATTWSSGATPSVTIAAEIFFGGCTATSAVPTVTGAGTWTTQSSGAGVFDQVSGYQIVSAGGAAAFSGTIPSGGYTALVVTFSAATIAATSAPAVTAGRGSAPSVTDPRDGAPAIAGGAAAVGGVLREDGGSLLDESGGVIFGENGT